MASGQPPLAEHGRTFICNFNASMPLLFFLCLEFWSLIVFGALLCAFCIPLADRQGESNALLLRRQYRPPNPGRRQLQ